MKAIDFITQARADLQEKTEQWKDLELFVKLQRSYISLQVDLPFFITKQTLAITEGKDEYYFDFRPVKPISLFVDKKKFKYVGYEQFYTTEPLNSYVFNEDVMHMSMPTKSASAILVYKYQKELKTLNCEIELPVEYYKALRYLLMSEIHEKPTRNTKDRNLNTHYSKLYDKELFKIDSKNSLKVRSVKSKYQRV